MNDTTPRAPNELHFQTHDGESLFYRHWPATGATRRGAIVLFHRGHEHGARMPHLVDELNLPEFDFFAWDARGHGRSPGQRGYSPSFGTSVRDVQTFVQHIGTAHGVAEQDIHVVAQSVGAVLISTWAHDYAPKVRGLTLKNRILVSPMATYSAVDGVPQDFLLVHLGARALGGAAMVFVEMTSPTPEGRITPACTGLYNDTQQAAFKRIVDFVHTQSSAKIAMQLGHSGPKGSTRVGWEGTDEPLESGN
ncbi:alpha/beta fold hydrolase, partial [Variovorax sp. RHLX14]|uniref:alpha/beta fold hydrolase n=1 Tax=Variovorax sp. RHLX14 TaxID=1259731 RepID=UPI003F487145